MSEDKEEVVSYPEYDGLVLAQLAQAQVDAKAEIDALAVKKTKWQKKFDHLRLFRIPEMMENEGINSVNLDGIGRLSTQGNIYAGVQKDKKEEAYRWLEDNGHGDLIKGTLNASSLKGFLKECIKNGIPFPDDLFKATPYMMATITKS
ncbi:hypothetical protein KAR91_47985 [Candidatus Pacearchaeota archaeon]|nr:hypothetical protein [Candidatus Pacearchaeota archaeon]